MDKVKQKSRAERARRERASKQAGRARQGRRKASRRGESDQNKTLQVPDATRQTPQTGKERPPGQQNSSQQGRNRPTDRRGKEVGRWVMKVEKEATTARKIIYLQTGEKRCGRQ